MTSDYQEIPGTVIRKKEYMGDRTLTKVLLAADAESIEDWAFANCSYLRELWLPATIAHVSEKAFQNCEKLDRICLYCCRDGEITTAPNSTNPVLLALARKCYPKDTDALIAYAKDETAFLKFLDTRIESFLASDDCNGFVPFLAGGEEDYLTEDAAAAFRHRRQILKCALIYERLLAEDRAHILAPEQKRICTEWLHTHNPAAAFGIMLTDTPHKDIYPDLYFSLGLHKDLPIEVLTDLADAQPELKAKLLRKHLEMTPSRSNEVFHKFSL